MYIKEYIVESEKWGSAIRKTYEKEDGTLWVTNGEYASQVNFCPITGYEAKVKVKAYEESK